MTEFLLKNIHVFDVITLVTVTYLYFAIMYNLKHMGDKQ